MEEGDSSGFPVAAPVASVFVAIRPKDGGICRFVFGRPTRVNTFHTISTSPNASRNRRACGSFFLLFSMRFSRLHRRIHKIRRMSITGCNSRSDVDSTVATSAFYMVCFFGIQRTIFLSCAIEKFRSAPTIFFGRSNRFGFSSSAVEEEEEAHNSRQSIVSI